MIYRPSNRSSVLLFYRSSAPSKMYGFHHGSPRYARLQLFHLPCLFSLCFTQNPQKKHTKSPFDIFVSPLRSSTIICSTVDLILVTFGPFWPPKCSQNPPLALPGAPGDLPGPDRDPTPIPTGLQNVPGGSFGFPGWSFWTNLDAPGPIWYPFGVYLAPFWLHWWTP